jgi:hypothetical protein
MVSSVWNAIVNWVRLESVAAMALVEAFIALGIAFGWWSWSNAQTGAVVGIVAALLAMFVRSQVTPVARVRPGKRVPAPGPSAGVIPPGSQARPQAGFPADPQQGPGAGPL